MNETEKTCVVCGVIFEAKRSDARFDTEKCKKKFQRNPELFIGVGEEVELVPLVEEKPFRFKTPSRNGFNEDDWREAKHWYDVPLAAIPKIEEGNPDMPEWMNGREYFLWRANDFEMNEENGKPRIINPIRPPKGPVVFVPGGQGSRQWGA